MGAHLHYFVGLQVTVRIGTLIVQVLDATISECGIMYATLSPSLLDLGKLPLQQSQPIKIHQQRVICVCAQINVIWFGVIKAEDTSILQPIAAKGTARNLNTCN